MRILALRKDKMVSERLNFKAVLIGVSIVCSGFLTSCVETSSLSSLWVETHPITVQEASAPYDIAPSAGGGNTSKRPTHRKVNSEKLLNAEGKWNLVEQGRDYDPAQAHLNARNKVNTKNFKKQADLSAHFEPDAQSGRDGKMRVLRLEPQDKKWKDAYQDYDVAQSSVSVPSSKIVHDGISVIETSLPQSAAMGGAVVIPPRKPVRGGGADVLMASSAQEFVSGAVSSELSVENIPVPVRKPVFAKGGGGAPVVQSLEVPTVSSGPVTATNIRSGASDGTARIVIEISTPTKYKLGIDPLRNVLQIKLENLRWDMKPQGTLSGTPLFGTYVAREQKDGSVLLEIRLKKESKVLKTMTLKPNDVSKHRIVIDLQN